MRAARAASSAWPRCMASNLPSATTVCSRRLRGWGEGKRRGGGAGGERRAGGEEAATGGGWDRAVGTHPRRECARDLGRRRETRSPGTPRRTPSATCTPRPSRADGTRAAGEGRSRKGTRPRDASITRSRRRPPAPEDEPVANARPARRATRCALQSLRASPPRASAFGRARGEPRLVGKPHHHGTQQPILEGDEMTPRRLMWAPDE